MRRHDRQCSDPDFFDYVFATAETLFLAMLDGSRPYCLPLNFVRHDKIIYIHSAKNGHKIDLIRANPAVAFSLAVDVQIIPAQSTTLFKSVCGSGMASIVEDKREKGMALELLARRYHALCHVPAPEADINRVAIIRIDITNLEGKRNGIGV